MRSRLGVLSALVALAVLSVWSCGDVPDDPVAPAEDSSLAPDLDGIFARSQVASQRIRVILRHPDMASQRAVAAAARAQGVPVLHQYRRLPFTAMKVSESALQGLLRSGRVLSWAEDTPQPPALNSALPVINGDDVHALGYDGSGQTVAILDTGIDPDHEYLGGRVVEERCFSTPDPDMYDDTSLCPNGQTTDDAANIDIPICLDDEGENLCNHGTHVAGIAAGYGGGLSSPDAPEAGVAPGADIIAIQIFTRFDGAGECGAFGRPPCVLTYPSDQLAGLEEVLILSSTYPIAAANMSLGGGFWQEHCDDDEDYEARAFAVNALVDANVATVIAAGTNGVYAVSGPACISNAVAVGATTDADEVADFSNYHPLLDLFAPGDLVVSSVGDNGYDEYDGTSMATPMVTGAFAVLRTILPTASVPQLVRLLQDTGVDITYSVHDHVTPRIDLLAAVESALLGLPPELTVNRETETVDEGGTAHNSGTFDDVDGGAVTMTASVGTVIQDDAAGTWAWSFATTDGPSESQTVIVTATDETGKTEDIAFDLVVNNVAPTVAIAGDQITSVLEGSTLLVKASFHDPGIHDGAFHVLVTCSDISGRVTHRVPGEVTITDPGALTADVTASCDYGDTSESGDPRTGTFDVSVWVRDTDGGEGSDDFDLQVENVAPTPALDLAGADLVNGVPTFIAQAADVLSFAAGVTDPGSDDLSLLWDWDDDTTDSESSLLGTDPDPFPSPDMSPRDETFSAIHSWASACAYGVSLTATDDDAGAGVDGVAVVITGVSRGARTAGFWQTQLRGKRSGEFDEAALGCYLDIVGQMSAVFDEEVDASTPEEAGRVLHPTGRTGMSELLDVQLLTAWLNFANGAFFWDEAVDTDGDGVPDTPFSTAVTGAEAVRLDPASTRYELEKQKGLLESINQMAAG